MNRYRGRIPISGESCLSVLLWLQSPFYERVKHLTNRNGILISKIKLNNTNRAIHLVEMVERT